MAISTNQPFDLVVENYDPSTDEVMKLRVAVDENGGLMYRSQLAAPLRPGISEGNYEVADVPPDQEMVFSQTTWEDGIGEVETNATTSRRAAFALGVDTRWPGLAIIGPDINAGTFSHIGTPDDGQIIDFEEAPTTAGVTNLFALTRYETTTGGQGYRLSSGGTALQGIEVFAAVPLDLQYHDARLWVALGEGTLPQYSTNYDTATPASVTFAAAAASVPDARHFGVLNNVLCSVSSSGSVARIYQATGDPTIAAGWDTGTPLGIQRGFYFTNLQPWEDTLVAGKQDGIFTFNQAGREIPLFPGLQKSTDYLNGASMKAYGTELWAQVGRNGLWRYTGQWENVSPAVTIPAAPWLTGVLGEIESDHDWVYVVVGSPDNVYQITPVAVTSTVRAGQFFLLAGRVQNTADGSRVAWHCIAEGWTNYLDAIPTIALRHSTIPRRRLYLGRHLSTYNNNTATTEQWGYIELPTSSAAPLNGTARADTNYTFRLDQETILETPWITFGFPTLPKSMLRAEINAFLPANTQLKVYYAVNTLGSTSIPENFTGYTQLGSTIDSTTTPVSNGGSSLYNLKFPPSTAGSVENMYRIKLRFALRTTSASVTPILYSFGLFAVPNFKRRRVITATVPVSQGLRSRGGGRLTSMTAQQIRDRIENASRATTPLKIIGPDGGALRVRLIDYSYGLAKIRYTVDGPHEHYDWVYNLTFQEVSYE